MNMKAYTDIEQSKKLAKILLIESADMAYATWTICNNGEYVLLPLQDVSINELQELYGNEIIPAWSLSALLQLFPHDDTHGVEINNYCGANEKVWFIRGDYEFTSTRTFIRISDELIDGLVELIIELKNNNLL